MTESEESSGRITEQKSYRGITVIRFMGHPYRSTFDSFYYCHHARKLTLVPAVSTRIRLHIIQRELDQLIT